MTIWSKKQFEGSEREKQWFWRDVRVGEKVTLTANATIHSGGNGEVSRVCPDGKICRHEGPLLLEGQRGTIECTWAGDLSFPSTWRVTDVKRIKYPAWVLQAAPPEFAARYDYLACSIGV